jgi:hypothetical protein
LIQVSPAYMFLHARVQESAGMIITKKGGTSDACHCWNDPGQTRATRGGETTCPLAGRRNAQRAWLSHVYLLCRPERPNLFFIFEEWDSEEALQKHFQTEHMKKFLQQAPSLLAGKVNAKKYTVTVASPLGV